MNFIKGRVSIFDQLKNISKRGYSYYGAVPAELLAEKPLNIHKILGYLSRKNTTASNTITCKITSAVYDKSGNIQEIGRHCVLVYPKVCNELKAIYVQENGTETPASILDCWDYREVTLGNDGYYIYFQINQTKDIELPYQFVFKNSHDEINS